MFPQITPERCSTAEKKENNGSCPCPEAFKHPVADPVKHHKKSHQRQDAYQIISQIKTKAQILQISHKELEHKMIFHILPAIMRILGWKIISSGKRSHHCRVGCIISIYRKTGVQNAVFHVKNVKHHPGHKDRQNAKKQKLFFQDPFSADHPFGYHKRFFLFFLFPPEDSRKQQDIHQKYDQISIKKRMLCPRAYAEHPGKNIDCPGQHQDSHPKRCRQDHPYPVSSFSCLTRKQTSCHFQSC